MKPILLSAGYGTRLGSLTKNLPKCLFEIKNKPIIQIWIEKLYDVGVRDILINTHYLHNQVKIFIETLEYKNLKINIVFEKVLLGTAGTLYKNKNFINGDECFLVHVDNYTKEDLHIFIKSHMKRKNFCLMSLMAHFTNQPSQCGILTVNDDNVVIEYEEKPIKPKTNLANSAIYILSKNFISETNNLIYSKDFSTQVIPNLLGKINCFVSSQTNIDIGTQENFLRAKLL